MSERRRRQREWAQVRRQLMRRRPRLLSPFVLAVLALHVPLFVYPVLRLCGWLDVPGWLTVLIATPLVSSQVLCRIYLRHTRSLWAAGFRRLADFWLGLSPVLLILLLLAEVLVLFDVISGQNAAQWVLGLSLLVGLAGLLNAMLLRVKRIHFVHGKLREPVRFVQITDVHMGSRNKAFLDRILKRINAIEPDFLCITGDFIDAPGVSEATLGALRSFKGPIYYCTGNHEKYEDFDDILARLNNLGVSILRDDTLHHRHDLQVIGVDDMEDALQVQRQLANIVVDRNAFTLLLYHRPRGLEAAAAAGVDLMLSGHTHNGQIMPFNLIVNRVFDRIVGLYTHDEARLYVSQGTGTWGPVMRLGTGSEITLFELVPEA